MGSRQRGTNTRGRYEATVGVKVALIALNEAHAASTKELAVQNWRIVLGSQLSFLPPEIFSRRRGRLAPVKRVPS